MADTTTAPSAAEERNYDLLAKMMPHLDRHLIFPLLEHLSQQGTFPAEALTQAKYDLLKHTNMTDYVAGLWQELHEGQEAPREFAEKREAVLAKLKSLEEKSRKVLELLENEEVIGNLRSDKMANLQYLKDNFGVGDI